jgi:hypothetical protein
MTTQEQADALLDQAQLTLDQGSAAQQSALAVTIRNFIGLHEIELANSGSQWRVDQLDGAVVQLTGGIQDHTASQASPFYTGLKEFANDSSSLDSAIGAAATEQARRLAGGTANAVNAATSGLMKSPAIVAFVVVAVVLAAAWAYRSFK